jgi:hypothetical protein
MDWMELDENCLELICVEHMGDQVRFSTGNPLEYYIGWSMRDGLRREQEDIEGMDGICLGERELML